MMLDAHSDTGFINKSKSRSQVSSFIFLSENEPTSKLNIPILTIAQIIKFVIASTAEAEVSALYITAKKNGSSP